MCPVGGPPVREGSIPARSLQRRRKFAEAALYTWHAISGVPRREFDGLLRSERTFAVRASAWLPWQIKRLV
jgi:hypothetical protein